eukprot:PhM_4_TR8394/c2_g1_i2/m.62434
MPAPWIPSELPRAKPIGQLSERDKTETQTDDDDDNDEEVEENASPAPLYLRYTTVAPDGTAVLPRTLLVLAHPDDTQEDAAARAIYEAWLAHYDALVQWKAEHATPDSPMPPVPPPSADILSAEPAYDFVFWSRALRRWAAHVHEHFYLGAASLFNEGRRVHRRNKRRNRAMRRACSQLCDKLLGINGDESDDENNGGDDDDDDDNENDDEKENENENQNDIIKNMKGLGGGGDNGEELCAVDFASSLYFGGKDHHGGDVAVGGGGGGGGGGGLKQISMVSDFDF